MGKLLTCPDFEFFSSFKKAENAACPLKRKKCFNLKQVCHLRTNVKVCVCNLYIIIYIILYILLICNIIEASRYMCGHCGFKVNMNITQSGQCPKCGYRVLYKIRPRYPVEYKAR